MKFDRTTPLDDTNEKDNAETEWFNKLINAEKNCSFYSIVWGINVSTNSSNYNF